MRRHRLADPMPVCVTVAACAALVAFLAPGWGGDAAPAITAASVRAQAARATSALVRPQGRPAFAMRRTVRPRAARIAWPGVRFPAAVQAVRSVPIAAIAARYGVSAAVLRAVVRWAPLVRRVAPTHSALLLAVIAQESRGQSGTYVEDSNTSWDAGLVGLNSSNWGRFGLDWATATNPAANVRAGASMLRAAVIRYGVSGGLALYNAGVPYGDGAYTQAVTAWLPAMRAALAS